jgi:hypothetical protein
MIRRKPVPDLFGNHVARRRPERDGIDLKPSRSKGLVRRPSNEAGWQRTNPAEKGQTMNSGSTVLAVLRRGRELLASGQSVGIISTISSLRDQASGRTRDLAYFALMDTLLLSGGEASISLLAEPESRAGALKLFDDTIRRITATLH